MHPPDTVLCLWRGMDCVSGGTRKNFNLLLPVSMVVKEEQGHSIGVFRSLIYCWENLIRQMFAWGFHAFDHI